MFEKFKKLDIFGEHIKFTFEKNHSFKTQFGASLSVLLGVILLTFGLSQVNKLVQSEIISLATEAHWINVGKNQFDPWAIGFEMGFGFSDHKEQNRSIASWEVYYVERDASGHKNKTKIDLFECKEKTNLRIVF